MTRVSRRPLKKELEERMFAVFWKAFADLKSPQSVFAFLEDLLSPAEKVMLAKRLAIAVLLEKGWDYEAISSAIKVSTATVNFVRFKKDSFGKGYQMVVRKIIADGEMAKFLEDLAVDVASAISPIGKIGLVSTAREAAKAHRYSQRRKRDVL